MERVTVTFLPSETTIEVPQGTLISDAAAMAQVTSLHLPCGARGTCGKCLVGLSLSGRSDSRSVLACRTPAKENCTVRLASTHPQSSSCITAHAPLDDLATWDNERLSPLCRKSIVKVAEPTIDSPFSDATRLERAVSERFGPGSFQLDLAQLRSLAAVLRKTRGNVSCTVVSTGNTHHLVDIEPRETPSRNIGVSCDIGTTTISVNLVDLDRGRVLSTRSDYNAQVARGADVISRIEYAATAQRLEEMRELVIGTVNKLLDAACADAGVDPHAVCCLLAAGNCTMAHLMLGLPPRYIREHPYVPTVNHPPLLRARELGLGIHPQATVTLSPGVGSYVGGDITAGLLCTPMLDDTGNVCLFIDIGTNGEIVVGNGEFLMTCACSAGPAFEGSGIRCGMRAGEGAIDSFAISDGGAAIDYTVIGDTKPAGVCGSGLISLLGELLEAGIIDRSGKFTDRAPESRRILVEATPGLVLVDAGFSMHGRPVYITEADIDNLIRTKAAIYAACDLILNHLGTDAGSLHRIYIAGGFGRFIDIDRAIRIGLFPSIDKSRFSYLGNTSLGGATLALLNRDYRERLASLPSKMTYLDLSSDPAYMDAYVAALFLPHTDLARFGIDIPCTPGKASGRDT